MFSFKKKPKAEDQDPHVIRASPSLPTLAAQGIPWPENLVDISSLNATQPPERKNQGATRTSLHSSEHPIAFHKPLWYSFPGNLAESHTNGHGPISKLYVSAPPSAFETRKTGSYGRSTRPGQRRTRVPPTSFNIMVVGGQGTGKSSLLKLLLETADISPTATPEHRATLDKFIRQRPKRTQSIDTASVEICESRYDRVLLSVVDTPGLDFHESRALKLDRQVSSVIRYLDSQFADTLNEEAKVVRQSKGDQHIHLCIYMVDPTAIMSVSARRVMSSVPTMTRSEVTISHHPPDLVADGASSDSDEEEDDRLTMSQAELRVIRRLATRTNILPVIARADSLTDKRLESVKRAVRRELHEAGLDFGVFGPPKFDKSPAENGHSVDVSEGLDEEAPEEEGRQARPVIKLRPSRYPSTRARSRSRSRRDYSDPVDSEEPMTPDTESVANVRFSAHIVAKMDLSDLMPFALIAPEQSAKKSALSTPTDIGDVTNESSPVTSVEDTHTDVQTTHLSPSGRNAKMVPFLQGPPADLKGVFVRKFRWGTVDVLDPNHCDFAALRTAVLSTHMKMLKIRTKEVLYENYRTEKLMARRATKNITEADTQKMLEEIGL